MITEIECPVWGNGHSATQNTQWDKPVLLVDEDDLVDSPRAGGPYRITSDAFELICCSMLNNRQKARLTHWLFTQRSQGEGSPTITDEVVKSYALSHRSNFSNTSRRAEMLLRYLIDRSENIGEPISVSKFGSEVLIASESIEWIEIFSLLEYLSDKGFIEHRATRNPAGCQPAVTARGHIHTDESIAGSSSKKAFVAMWFSKEMMDAYENGIKPAIKLAGYVDVRIDQKPDVNKIDDEIIAEIRDSRFVVADMTHGEDGARGGVYFEAGLAFGLNIPVIYTCHQNKIDEVHFDTRQYYHIVWNNPQELCGELKNRIMSVVGPGPLQNHHNHTDEISI